MDPRWRRERSPDQNYEKTLKLASLSWLTRQFQRIHDDDDDNDDDNDDDDDEDDDEDDADRWLW